MKLGVENYGNSLLDTLPDGHPFKGIMGEGVIVDLNRNVLKNAVQPQKESVCSVRHRFLGLPLIKIKTDAKGNKHFKLFFFLPILKIKHDSKGGKTYKLFSFLPLFKIKSK